MDKQDILLLPEQNVLEQLQSSQEGLSQREADERRDLTFIQLIVIVSVRNLDHFWKGKRPSWLLIRAIALAFVVSLALPYLTIFETWFHFTPLSVGILAIILALMMVYVFILDMIKVWYYRIVVRAK